LFGKIWILGGVIRMDDEFELEDAAFEDPLEEDLADIEGKDPARAKFIKGYLKATI
jgi:hypothetical protein